MPALRTGGEVNMRAAFFMVALLTCALFCGCGITDPLEMSEKRILPANSEAIFANLKRIHLLSMVYYQRFRALPCSILDLKKLDRSLIEDLDLEALDESYNLVQLAELSKIKRPDMTPFVVYNTPDSAYCWIVYIDGHVAVYRKEKLRDTVSP